MNRILFVNVLILLVFAGVFYWSDEKRKVESAMAEGEVLPETDVETAGSTSVQEDRKEEQKEDYIHWVDFGVSKFALSEAYEYDRLGLNEEYTEFLGNKVICHSIPIRPGRNLAIIVEAAAVNHRQKKMGYNAAQELYRRVQESINKNKR